MPKSQKQFLAEFGNRVSISPNRIEISNNTSLTQGSDLYLQPNSGIFANGGFGTAGQVLTSNGSASYWAAGGGPGSVNTAAQYTWTNTHTFTADIKLDGIIANNTLGTAGQLLATDGTKVYWTGAGGASVNTDAQYTWTNTHTFSNTVTFSRAINAGGTIGTNGQVLTSNGTAVIWANGGSGSVNTAAQYIWTNTHTYTNLITISTNGGTTNGYMKWGEDPSSYVTLNLQPGDNNFVFYRSTRTGNQESVMAWFYNPDPANTFQKSVTFIQDIMLFGGIYDNYNGSKGTAGQILSATGSATGQGVKWIDASSSGVNTAAQYTWTNTHVFNYNGTFANVVSIQNQAESAFIKYRSVVSGINRESTAGMQSDGKFLCISTLSNGLPNPIMGWWSNANSSLPADTESGIAGQAGNGLFVQVPLVLRNGIVPYNTGSRGTAGQVLTATGEAYPAAGLRWADIPGGGSVNTAATYTWTNTHTFNSTVNFNSTVTATSYSLSGGGKINNNGTGISVPGNIQADGGAVAISVATAGGVQAGFYAGGGGKTCGYYIGTDNSTHMACGTAATTFDTAGNFFIPGYFSPAKGIYGTNGLGSSGQVLQSTGSGVTWAAAGGGGTAPGNKGPITVTTDASWSLNTGSVQNVHLAGSISPDKLGQKNGAGFIVDGAGVTHIYATGGGATSMFSNNSFYFPDALVNKPGGGPFEGGSDIRTKKNISVYTDGLKEIIALKPVSYQYNGLTQFTPDDGKTYVGLIAQDTLETPMSYMVKFGKHKLKDEKGEYSGEEQELYSIDSNAITYATINAIKELNELVTNLTEENKKLRSDLDSLLNKTTTPKKK